MQPGVCVVCAVTAEPGPQADRHHQSACMCKRGNIKVDCTAFELSGFLYLLIYSSLWSSPSILFSVSFSSIAASPHPVSTCAIPPSNLIHAVIHLSCLIPLFPPSQFSDIWFIVFCRRTLQLWHTFRHALVFAYVLYKWCNLNSLWCDVVIRVLIETSCPTDIIMLLCVLCCCAVVDHVVCFVCAGI